LFLYVFDFEFGTNLIYGHIMPYPWGKKNRPKPILEPCVPFGDLECVANAATPMGSLLLMEILWAGLLGIILSEGNGVLEPNMVMFDFNSLCWATQAYQ
jgi:hypothetical protein